MSLMTAFLRLTGEMEVDAQGNPVLTPEQMGEYAFVVGSLRDARTRLNEYLRRMRLAIDNKMSTFRSQYDPVVMNTLTATGAISGKSSVPTPYGTLYLSRRAQQEVAMNIGAAWVESNEAREWAMRNCPEVMTLSRARVAAYIKSNIDVETGEISCEIPDGITEIHVISRPNPTIAIRKHSAPKHSAAAVKANVGDAAMGMLAVSEFAHDGEADPYAIDADEDEGDFDG